MNKRLWIALAALAVAAGVGAKVLINDSTRPDHSGQPIVIGAVLPLTGIAAIVGEAEKNGIDLAVREINAKGGIGGRSLSVVTEDDHTDPTQTVSAVQKLVSVEHVTALIGGTWDFLANAAEPIIERDRVVMITPSTLPDTLQKTSPYLFVTHSPVASNEQVIANFLKKSRGTNVVTVSVNNLWGQAHLATFRKAITDSGKTLSKEILLPQFDTNDIQTEMTILKSLHPDIIITAINFGDSVAFLRKKTELGVGGKVLGDFHFLDGYTQGNIPKELLAGVSIFVFSDPTDAFVNAYRKEYGSAPGTYADTAYDAVYVLKQAIENSGGKADTASIVVGLHEIVGYRGASGVIDFSKSNYPENKIPILKTFNGTGFVSALP